jgi:hypothetical protein
MSRYTDYDDLIRDLDAEGLSDEPFAGEFDDEDLALLGAMSPDKPRPKPAPRKPVKKPARKAKPSTRR